jgi:hypothetical protein
MIRSVHRAQREWRYPIIGLAAVMAAPVVIPGLVASAPFVKSAFAVSTETLGTRFAYEAISETSTTLITGGNLGDVNLLGIGTNTLFTKIGGQLISSKFGVSINNGLAIETNSQMLLNFTAGRLAKKFHGRIGAFSESLGGKSAIKGYEHIFKTGSQTLTSTFANYLGQ